MRKFLSALFVFALVGCATFSGHLPEFKSRLRAGNPMAAAENVKEKALQDSGDQVVHLFEYATALQAARQFDESTKAFLKAEDLTDIKDYHSLSRITGSLLLNEGMVQYKGEDYEKVLINAMLAINFLSVGKLESAQVETRKLNDKLYKYRFEAKRNYEQNAFAFYISAMIWEENKNWDSAFIDYKRTYELNPNFSYIKDDLLRAAKRARRNEDLAKWKKEFKTPSKLAEPSSTDGELVLVFAQGWAPEKRPHPNWATIPKLYPVHSETKSANLVVESKGKEESQSIYSVEDVAIKTMDDAYAPLIAKRAAGIATKAVVADQLRQKNQLLGDLSWIAMNVMDRADLRQWSSLPQTFQVARMRLPKGKYRAQAAGLNGLGKDTGETSEWMDVELKAGKRTFIFWRSFR